MLNGTLEVRDNLSLYQIEEGLQELMAAYSEAEDDVTRAAIEEGIREYVQREVTKVDSIRSYLRHCEVMAVAAKCEADSQMERSRAWKKRAEKLEAACLGTMVNMGAKRLEGSTGALVVKKNGGVAPLDITEPSIIPDEYCTATVKLPYNEWRVLCEDQGLSYAKVSREISNTAVRKALEAPCWLCDGKGGGCSSCGGSGKQGVPGARLLERGSHLEVR